MGSIITSGLGAQQRIITSGYGYRDAHIGRFNIILNPLTLSCSGLFVGPIYSGKVHIPIKKIQFVSDDIYFVSTIYGASNLELKSVLVSIRGKNYYPGVIVEDILYVSRNKADRAYILKNLNSVVYI